MIIFKDIFNGDEIISDVYKLIDAPDGGNCLWEIDGAMVKPGKEDVVLEGANASAEGEDADEGGDEGGDSEPVLNIASMFRLQKVPPPDKKGYTDELKKYIKNVLAAMTENGKSAEDVAEFKKGAGAALKKISANYKNYDTYIGESAEPDGKGKNMYVLVDFREDGMTPYATVWKHGLIEMKV